ncbi:hypothetical protein CEQ90_08080 [Lewinellaceae bacterium SD302]|nr:hypothetical protein CEQ90_08080 [Lewinellaceae bacterium SD302]
MAGLCIQLVESNTKKTRKEIEYRTKRAMKTSTANLITEYKFQDRKRGLWSLPVICVMAAILMLMADPGSMIQDGNVIHSLFAASVVITLMVTYDWRNREINRLIFAAYLISVGLEFYLAGVPDQPISPSASYNSGKGAVMEIFIYLLPYVYLLLKLGIALPLFLISKK